MLLGAGYDAYVAMGRAALQLAQGDLRSQTCPLLSCNGWNSGEGAESLLRILHCLNDHLQAVLRMCCEFTFAVLESTPSPESFKCRRHKVSMPRDAHLKGSELSLAGKSMKEMKNTACPFITSISADRS